MKRKVYSFLSILLIALLIAGCSSSSDTDMTQSISDTRFQLGTVVSIQLFGTEDKDILSNAFDLIDTVENEMSLNIDTSDLVKINANAGIEPTKLNDDEYEVIEKALEYAKLSDGGFDITMEPVVDLWGIGTDDAAVPSDEDLEAALSEVDYTKVQLDPDNSTVYLPANTAIDLGGIAKGFAADKVDQYLKEQGIKKAIINLGGNVMVLGSKSDDEDFRIGLQDPFKDRNEYFGIVDVSDKTVVTSGVYERNFTEDGVFYHHILSPVDGYPVENGLAAVTVIADNSIDADALSTSLFVMGVDKGLELVSSLDGVDCIFIKDDKEIISSDNMDIPFELTDDSYTWVNDPSAE